MATKKSNADKASQQNSGKGTATATKPSTKKESTGAARKTNDKKQK